MTPPESQDLSGFSMFELFRLEAENQTALLSDGLLALEQNPESLDRLEELMRAAHSTKGAARMVNVDIAVRLTHAMEDCFVGAQQKQQPLSREQIDTLLRGVDLLNRIAQNSEASLPQWEAQHGDEVEAFVKALSSLLESTSVPTPQTVESPPQLPLGTESPAPTGPIEPTEPAPRSTPSPASESARQVVRVTPENLNRLLGLAGESLVTSRSLASFVGEINRLKGLQYSLYESLDRLCESLAHLDLDEKTQAQVLEVREREVTNRKALSQRLSELEVFDRRLTNLSGRLHQEVLDCRMRPFSDGVQGFSRLVRDAARDLGKEVRLEITGGSTPVDRDILERIEAPLGHLLRNAVDHGVETNSARRDAGKAEYGSIRLEARHSAGMLLITVTDDGAGIDFEAIRRRVRQKGLASAEVAEKLSEAELLEFLFLPGFTMRDEVTEISGRGVGLDVVQSIVKEIGGSVRVITQAGQGTSFQLHLPLTLSVVRALVVEIAGEPYAFPLNRIMRTLKLPRTQIEAVEGRQHFTLGEQHVGLVTANQVLGLEQAGLVGDEISVVVLGDSTRQFGLVVEEFCGERELTVRPLDPRLGKIPDISTAALMPDQSPVLIVDVDDVLRSIEILVSEQRLARISRDDDGVSMQRRKRVLVVDDSLTVRELERKLITSQGYEVEVAVDGMDGWNAVRTRHYDLVVTDVDMPRMDGIDLVKLIKDDSRLQTLPVMIVSYKDREEDRYRGLEAGADYYLAKGSFHDETLLQAVEDLIGEADDA